MAHDENTPHLWSQERAKERNVTKESPNSDDGRWVFITGATSGIGLEAAIELAKRGDHVILGARNKRRGETARQRLLKEAPQAKVHLAIGDLSTKKGVQEEARDVLEHTDRLDVLILNAGTSHPRRHTTEEGIEATFAVNHLSAFRMAHHLHGALKKSREPRVIIVASHAHRSAKLDLEDVELKNRRYSGWLQYCNTKLMNLLMMNSLARRWRDDGITVNALHPGVVDTGIARNWFFGRLAFRIFGRTAKQGAETIIYLATDPIARNVTAQYFADRQPLSPRRSAFNEDLQEELWRISETYGI